MFGMLQPTRLSPLRRLGVRYVNDLTVQRGRHGSTPMIQHGPPGRSAVSGHTVTVFGCTGFLGKYVVQQIARKGTQVVVPYRDEDEKRPLRVMGDLGQIVPLEWDAKNLDQIRECVRRSDTVYNLVGRDYETRNFSYRNVNATVAGNIARICREEGVPRLIHVSHLNASADSPSAFYRTKHNGEEIVRREFPEATIVRPGPMYGHEDWFLNDMAQWPIKYALNGSRTRTMPVHVVDVAEALSKMLDAPKTSIGSTFVLPGPEVFTYDELLNLVSFFTMRPRRSLPPIPGFVASMFASVVNRLLWFPTVAPDEITRKFIDDAGAKLDQAIAALKAKNYPEGWSKDFDTATYDVNGRLVKSWADLDIQPARLQDHAVKYLRIYRSSENAETPLEVGSFKPPRPYKVVR
ncbi:hypothetical protein BD324DRAFT_636205 [Kockovaella imperatae]|uniref:NAD(P)-binding domain-containing protein n=1 Tax=Kockovaella imperatae TaxID=4999 RepID=A0A1Y1UAD8_9TREE|nr:hypothetical protein BD324DRAFT_636205 [Kockovaella imperatae]ORX34514.1 hypothetical protein BD324DRAFT_636205 [Kockovaella imperatae]